MEADSAQHYCIRQGITIQTIPMMEWGTILMERLGRIPKEGIQRNQGRKLERMREYNRLSKASLLIKNSSASCFGERGYLKGCCSSSNRIVIIVAVTVVVK